MPSRRRGTTIEIRVQPRAPRDEVVRWLDDETLKVRITAPPVEGKANARLTRFLARSLGVPDDDVRIVRGGKTTRKMVFIANLSPSEVRARISVKE